MAMTTTSNRRETHKMDDGAAQGFFAASAMWIGILVICVIGGCVKSQADENYTDTRLTVEFKTKTGGKESIAEMKKWVNTAPCRSNEWTTISTQATDNMLKVEFFKKKK